MSRPRDTQRQKVYDAERELFTHRPMWTDIEDAQRWLDEKLSSAYLRRKYGRFVKVDVTETPTTRTTTEEKRVTPITIRPGYGHTRATGNPYSREIQLPKWAREPIILLHETAHVLAPRVDAAWHGWQFCEVYLDLVRHVMGKQTADELKAAFKRHRVRFTEPRAKRELTEEQKQVLRDRLAATRQAKAARPPE